LNIFTSMLSPAATLPTTGLRKAHDGEWADDRSYDIDW